MHLEKLIDKHIDKQTNMQPVDDGPFNRFLVLSMYKFMTYKYLRRIFHYSGNVIFISKYCIKSTPFTTLTEARTIQFVSQYTSVPVPKIYCAFEHKGRTYIVMKRIEGHDLSHGWLQRSEASKSRILEQLRSMIAQWRNIPPPPGIGVANIDGGAIYDPRLPKKSNWGPFATIKDFHKELRNGIEAEEIQNEPSVPGLCELIAFHDRVWEAPVFTHGDLSSLNIIACGDDVVGIIDWETAGWMPSYWEYTSAWNTNPQNRFWQDEVGKILTPMPRELEMESIRRRYFGDV